jgi:hypothetical protein
VDTRIEAKLQARLSEVQARTRALIEERVAGIRQERTIR